MMTSKKRIIGRMDEIAKQNEPKYVDVQCLKKSKRVLLFLADFFIVFILSLGLFHLGVFPLGRVITDYNGQMTSLHESQVRRDDILYHYELLFPRAEGARGYDDFEENLVFTADHYIHRMVDEAQLEKYDVFAGYFLKIRADQSAFVSFYRDLDKGYDFFDITDSSVTLKDTYKQEFLPAFNERDTMSEKGQKDYQTFEDKIFSRGYGVMLNDIMEKDLTKDGVSYINEQKTITNVLQYGKMLMVICAVASLLIVWLINHIIIPMFSKNRKTIGMMAMRITRVHRSNFDVLSLPMVYLSATYALAGEMLGCLFVPWGATSFNELFALPMLFILSLISLVYILGSLAMILFDGYNRSIGDFLCRSYCLSEDEFDNLIREKGYKA